MQIHFRSFRDFAKFSPHAKILETSIVKINPRENRMAYILKIFLAFWHISSKF